ncbi:unnamed protein product [Rotaria sordida]|uniref:Pentatricopeptide repeat-containing protein n=1 Tax=Rotaria sordida TaxID=392033 RepID=A0A814RIC1_9BILA|nr:unnamed protein product [Rotaria sordida]CAF3949352.1 unnamed protein product [Rotaria sordida]
MLKKLLDHRLIFLTSGIKRSVIIPSDFDLCTQMKLLNDKKKFKEALELFDKYKENNNKTLSSYTITQALKASARIRDLQRGSTIHQFISSDMKDNSYILVSLIHLYMQCSEVTRAQSLFDTASEKSLHTYGAMMKGYIKNNMTNKAIDLFKEIKNPDEVIIIILCNACAQLGTNEALSLIKKGYIKNNMANKAIDLFKEIKDPDEIVINLLFTACAELGTSEALNLTKIVSSQMPKHFYSNLRLLTSLLDALMQCGNVTHAEALFNRSIKKISPLYGVMMKGNSSLSIYYYRILLKFFLFFPGYNTNNMANKSIDLFNEIENPDDVNFIMLFNACAQLGTHEALILIKKVLSQIPKYFYLNFHLLTSQLDALIKCGDFSTAEILLSKMKKSVISYGNLMSGYLKTDNPEKVLDLFDRMKNDNIEPDFIICLCLIKALSHIGDYSLSQLTVQQIPNSFLLNDRIQNTLIDMWVSSN